MSKTSIFDGKQHGAHDALNGIRSKLQKAETLGSMSTADVVAFFDDVFEALKDHALKKHAELSEEKISGEQAFSRLHARDDQFRSIVSKAQTLQTEFANSI